MEKEPLLSHTGTRSSPPSPPFPYPVAEDDEIASFIHLSSKTHLHRSNTAPTTVSINEIDNSSHNPPPKLAQSSIVRQGFLFLIIYLILGVAVYSFNRDKFRLTETHPVVDAIYFCIVTMCTIGYSDITPDSTLTKSFAIIFVIVAFGVINVLLSGILTYVLDLQENYLLKTIKGGGSCLVDVNEGRMRIRMKVALALSVVVLCIGIGVILMHLVEKLDWFDSFYLSVISVTTVGYGEKGFSSLTGRIFGSIWLLVSTLSVARAFLYLAEARVEKKHRRMVKWLLCQDMTAAEFLAADIDNDGFVSKSEYMMYKLKEMGMVPEKTIFEISKQFQKLDSGNRGKITLANLGGIHQYD